MHFASRIGKISDSKARGASPGDLTKAEESKFGVE
jgi:hypothetical protein